jgi:imidazole glycerol-phosphate synthase subunit HisH
MKIVIVDLGSGNLGSIPHALRRLNYTAVITSSESEIEQAERIILPGVGAFDSVVAALDERGLRPVLSRRVLEERVPMLGICVGMQMLLGRSEEGELPGLNWIPGTVRKFEASEKLKVPHMGWNTVARSPKSRLLETAVDVPRFYFVHSYYVDCEQSVDVAGRTVYGVEFSSVIERDNIMGVQFHPERSHSAGLDVLRSFIEDS